MFYLKNTVYIVIQRYEEQTTYLNSRTLPAIISVILIQNASAIFGITTKKEIAFTFCGNSGDWRGEVSIQIVKSCQTSSGLYFGVKQQLPFHKECLNCLPIRLSIAISF